MCGLCTELVSRDLILSLALNFRKLIHEQAIVMVILEQIFFWFFLKLKKNLKSFLKRLKVPSVLNIRSIMNKRILKFMLTHLVIKDHCEEQSGFWGCIKTENGMKQDLSFYWIRKEYWFRKTQFGI